MQRVTEGAPVLLLLTNEEAPRLACSHSPFRVLTTHRPSPRIETPPSPPIPSQERRRKKEDLSSSLARSREGGGGGPSADGYADGRGESADAPDWPVWAAGAAEWREWADFEHAGFTVCDHSARSWPAPSRCRLRSHAFPLRVASFSSDDSALVFSLVATVQQCC